MDRTVSLVIPAFNEESDLRILLASLRRHILFPAEIVVVDNGSTDGTARVASEFQVPVVKTDRRCYPATARNRGAAATSGAVLAFLDADVIVAPEWAEALRGKLTDNAVAARNFVTGAPCLVPVENSWIERYWFAPLSVMPRDYINGANLVTSRSLFEELGGFNEGLETGEDVDFCRRAAVRGIEPEVDRGFRAVHSGFPKTVSAFVRRELWHGKGDFVDLRSVLQSRVAFFTVVFVLLHLVLVGSALCLHGLELIVSVVGILCACLFAAWVRLRADSTKRLLIGAVIHYLYFVGRAMSALAVLTNRARARRTSAPAKENGRTGRHLRQREHGSRDDGLASDTVPKL